MRTQTQNSDSVNAKLLLKTLVAFKKGDFSARLPGEWTGEAGKIADTLNEIIELSDRTAKELERVSRVVGKEGKIVHRSAVPGASGSWLRLRSDLMSKFESGASSTLDTGCCGSVRRAAPVGTRS